jgi:hypothetical protein
MVGSSVSTPPALVPMAAPEVVLGDPDSASGLADMLHQFVEQTLAESPQKVAVARGLRGAVVIRSQEDQAVAVRIAFLGDRIELCDIQDSVPAGVPSIIGGFLAVAHVTSGQLSPVRAVLSRQLVLRAGLGQLPFMLRVLGFMRIQPARGFPAHLAVVALVVLALAAALAFRYFNF